MESKVYKYMDWPETVSYTHLDVYKRQMQHFFFLKILFKEMCLYQSYINTF